MLGYFSLLLKLQRHQQKPRVAGGSAEPLAPLLLSVPVHAKLGRSERERNCRGQDFPWAPVDKGSLKFIEKNARGKTLKVQPFTI